LGKRFWYLAFASFQHQVKLSQTDTCIALALKDYTPESFAFRYIGYAIEKDDSLLKLYLESLHSSLMNLTVIHSWEAISGLYKVLHREHRFEDLVKKLQTEEISMKIFAEPILRMMKLWKVTK
jgi:hypothetical protein